MFATVTGRASQQGVHRVGRWKIVPLAFCIAIFSLTFIVPIIGLIWTSFTPYGGSLNAVPSLTNYVKAIGEPLFWNAFTNSVEMALIIVLVGVPLAITLAYGAIKSKARGARLIDVSSLLPEAIPTIVYRLGLFLVFLTAPGFNNLYGTIWPLVLATLIVPIPVAFRVIAGNSSKSARSLKRHQGFAVPAGSALLDRFFSRF